MTPDSPIPDAYFDEVERTLMCNMCEGLIMFMNGGDSLRVLVGAAEGHRCGSKGE